MSLRSERVYRGLLALLPGAFRQEAEAELIETFRHSYARVSGRGLRARLLFWCRMAADVVVTGWAEFRTARWAARHLAPPPRVHSRMTLMRFTTDLRLAVRSLVRQRGFAGTAVLTLSLGIGAAVAIFSVVSAVLLQPLPYRDPSQVVIVWQELRARSVPEFPFPIGDIPDLREKGTLFESVATVQTGRTTMPNDGGQNEQIRTAFVTPNLFDLLGLTVVRGRGFLEEDGTPIPQGPPPAAGAAAGPPPAPPLFAAMLSHEFWQRRFGGDPAVVGRVVPFGGGAQAEIVGVAEPGAELLFAPRQNVERTPDVWFAARIDFANGTRTAGGVRVVARMKPGVTVAQAQAQMEVLAAELRETYPVKKNAGVYINVVSMHDTLVSDVRVAIVSLMAAVSFVLLIACANVANLLMTQSMRRERELAVRAALGANRAALVRQMFAESVVLTAVAAAAGLGLARLGIVLLQRMGPATLPRLQDVAVDARVLAFSLTAAFASAVLVGLLPALRASRPNLGDVLRRTGRSIGLGSGRLRHGLVVVEVALTFVLLVGTGLLLRSVVALQRVDPGYDPNGVLTFTLSNLPTPSLEARIDLTRRLQEAIGALPGVLGVSGGSPLPLDGGSANMPWGTEASDATQFQQANVHTTLPGYFETMRTRVIEGRVYTHDDRVPNLTRVVIDEALAARAYPGQSALGRPLLLRIGGTSPVPFEIIGVVAHQRHASLAEDGREAIFFVDGQGVGGVGRWIVRATGDPVALADPVRAAIARVDDRIAVAEVQPLSAFVDRAQAPTRFALALTGVFAAIAVVLAVVGLYGVLSTLVRQRTAEIGVRMAFGAERGAIFRLIVGRGLLLAALGVGIGVIAALGMTRAIQSMLVGVRAADPMTFAAIAVLFLGVAAAACGVPAIRAARLDPVTALRSE
jgi:putative ABC transport system permease protein